MMFKDVAIAVGSFLGQVGNAVEMLDLATWSWVEKDPYPFALTVNNAPIIKFFDKEEFLMLGGWGGSGRMSRIAHYNPVTDKWQRKGNLQNPRSTFGVTIIPGGLLIMGGESRNENHLRSEKCVYNGDKFECVYQTSTEATCKSS